MLRSGRALNRQLGHREVHVPNYGGFPGDLNAVDLSTSSKGLSVKMIERVARLPILRVLIPNAFMNGLYMYDSYWEGVE